MITIKHKGDYSKATRYFERVKKAAKISVLDRYAKEGVAALSAATPVDSGRTAACWTYEIEYRNSGAAIHFLNTNVNKGVNIAIILQYGHGTGTGGWVEGRDYINPAIQPVFDKIVDDLWREVTSA